MPPPTALDAAMAACAAEPIHAPGAVQGWGVLLALDPADLRVTHWSADAPAALGREVAGASLDDLLPAAAAAVRAGGPVGPQLVGGEVWPAAAHRHAGRVLLELYRPQPAAPPADPAGVAGRLAAAVAGLEACESVEGFAGRVAVQLRAATGYDRALVYRFAPDWSGQVVAEDLAPGQDPYLGLWYPASDVPGPCRHLYKAARVRVLADAAAATVPLVGGSDPVDLSPALLRAMHPHHTTYLQNMGTRATLVVSVVRGGALWGMVALHHRTPRRPAPDLLHLCDLYGLLLTAHLAAAEAREQAAAGVRADRLLQALDRLDPGDRHWTAALADPAVGLAGLVGADGVAVVCGREVAASGRTPAPDAVRRLAGWLAAASPGAVYATDRLGEAAGDHAPPAETAAGLLAVPVPGRAAAWVLWVRGERAAGVTWAGDNRTGLEHTPAGPRLHPRASFAAWQQEVRGRSAPWTAADRAAVGEAFRATLAGFLARWERLRAERERDWQAHLFAQVRDAVIVTDPDGVVTLWNRAAEGLFGRPAADAVGHPAAALLAGTDWSRATTADAEFAAEWQVARPDGQEVWVDTRTRPLADPAGRPTGHMWVSRDVTDAKRLEAMARQAQKLEAVGRLAGGIAHDFNNLLTAINGYAELLAEGFDPDAPERELLGEIRRAGGRGADLTRQLLAHSRQQAVSLEPTDVAGVVRAAAGLVGRLVRPPVTLDYELPAGACWATADGGLVEQVLVNLCVNARDALPAGGPVRVRVEGGAPPPPGGHPGGYVRLSVADAGCGMAPAVAARAFEPFFTTKPVGQGSGLGLATVYGIARQCGGGVTVDTAPGRGSTFAVYLPASDPQTAG